MGNMALDAAPQDRQQFDHRDRIISSLEQENGELKEQLRTAQAEVLQAKSESGRAVSEIRQILTPLYQALRLLFGEIDKIAPATSGGMSAATVNSGVWDSWKLRLGGQKAKCIDAFLTHGALTQTQLRVIVGCANSSVPGLISDLKQLGLLDKNGSKYSLKEL